MKLWLLLLLSLTACAPSGPTDSLNVGIIGGSLVVPADPIASSTAFVLMYDPRTHDAVTCSAVVLSNDVIATAAHCFWPLSAPRRDTSYLKFVLFGTSVDIQSTATFARAITVPETSYALHPGYKNDSNKNDLALLKLPGAVPSGIRAASILPPGLRIPSAVTVAGFGIVSDEQENAPPNLYNLKSLTMSLGTLIDSDCPLCVNVKESPAARPAHGDSGGPAFAVIAQKTYVFGIDSHSQDDSHTNEFYTALTPYVSWIQTTAKTLGSTNAIRLTQPVASSKVPPKKSLLKSNAYSPVSKPQPARTRA